MDKYDVWLKTGLEKLFDDFANGSFKPQNESDIKCHLYYTLLQTKSQIEGLTPNHLILSEFGFPSSLEKIDLTFVRWRQREDVFHPRLLVEIKETSLPHLNADEVEGRIMGDIEKLRKYRKTLVEEKKTNVLKFFKTPAEVFFFRGASKHGISTRTDNAMKKLQEKYDDITLLWGPR